jgi:peptidyl-prolyl cis-trans isomerase A (cyclophilin A)
MLKSTLSMWTALTAAVVGLLLTVAGAAQPASEPAPAPAQPTEDELVYVKMTTSMGDIFLELNRAKAPISVDNFLKYADAHFYEGTIFHRVIPSFMIQGGGFTADMKEKQTNPPIKNEWENGLKNKLGTIAMARKGDRQPNTQTVNSATSQFYINVKDNPALDGKQPDGGAYAVFGRVVEGMETVEKIKSVPTTEKRPHKDVPVDAVVIQSVARMSEDEVKDLKARMSGGSSETQPKNDGKTDPKPEPGR